MTRSLCAAALIAALGLAPGACSTAPKSEGDKAELSSDTAATLATFRKADPVVQSTLDNAIGYAVLPNVGKGAVVVGAAYGKGEVFEHGTKVGYCDMTQGSIGAQIGGQRYSELVVFTTQKAMDDFKDGEFSLSATASAVAVESGKAKVKDSGDGVVVFITDEKGLMAEAAVGGQKFRYRPL